MGRLIAIGDIHGQYSKLLDLMDQIDPGKGDKFFLLGDYVDSGPQSAEVIEYLIRFRRYRDASFILGNHDSWFLDWIQSGYADPAWLYYGGMATLESYLTGPGSWGQKAIPWDHQEFLKQASGPLVHETMFEREYVFAHGMLPPTRPLKDYFDTEHALWSRPESHGYHNLDGTGKPRRISKKPIAWDPKQYLVFAHTPHDTPTEYDGIALCIDTGAKMDDRPLTAAILPAGPTNEFKFLQSSMLTVDPDKMHHDEEEDEVDY